MPKRILQLNDFSGGLNVERDIADIANNEVGVAENLMFNIYGGVQPSYSMNQTANKVTAYQSSNIQTVEPGYGLGYFETDRVRDAQTVAVTTSIQGVVNITDGSVTGSPNGFVGLKHNTGGEYKELMHYAGGSQVNLTTSFSIGTIIKIVGVSFTGAVMTQQGQGLYTVVEHNGNNLILNRKIRITPGEPPNNNNQTFWGATITGHKMGDNLIFLAHPSVHKVDVFSTDASSWNTNAITLRNSASGTNSKMLFIKGGDNIRSIDTADKNDSTIQWYGFIQREHFRDLSNTKTSDTQSITGYFARNNKLSRPTETTLSSAIAANTNGIANNTSYPSADAGFRLKVTTVQQDGAIPKGTKVDPDGSSDTYEYEFASSFIYDGNQESLLTKYSTTHNTGNNDLKQLAINITVKAPFTEGRRVTGGRIYARPVDSDDEFIMVLDIHLTKGCRTKLSDDYTKWHDAGSNQYNCPTATGSGDFIISEFGLLTYEVLNGFSSSIYSNYIGEAGENFKDAVVANNRVFVCNVTMADEDTGIDKANSFDNSILKSFPDRIMYSMPNRFDTFPYHNFIEAAKADADVYVALEAYADRLLAYKNKSLDIINISGDDRNWFLEDSKQYQGVLHPEAVKKTQYGVIWVNKQGLHMYNGQTIVNLKDNKISDTVWEAHVTNLSSIIYDEQESMAFVVKNMSNNGDAYMVDLRKGNFTLIKNFVNVANDGVTNSVDTDSNNTLIAADTGNNVDVYQFNRQVVAAVSKLTTKAFDFGSVHQVKKVYAVHVTYKSDQVLTGKFSLLEEDGTSTALSGTVASATSNWAKVKLTPSAPVVCNKLSVKLDSTSTSAKVYINDIGIEYRIIHKKGS